MLSHAKKKTPNADFIQADARDFKLPPVFKAVVSTLDSLNHVLKLAELKQVFGNVRGALAEGGYFLFDLNLKEAYRKQWHKSSHIIKDDNVCIVRGGYDPDGKIGTTNILMFSKDESWKRSDITLYQRCYSPGDVISALKETGFTEVKCFRARDLKMRGRLAIGRGIFRTKK
jgi:SAM-dependent methyltransferase